MKHKIDLSKIDNSVTFWLEKNINHINSCYKNKEELIKKLCVMKNEINVSDIWFNNFINKIKQNNNEQNIKYIYNIYLCGCCLSTNEQKNGNSKNTNT